MSKPFQKHLASAEWIMARPVRAVAARVVTRSFIRGVLSSLFHFHPPQRKWQPGRSLRVVRRELHRAFRKEMKRGRILSLWASWRGRSPQGPAGRVRWRRGLAALRPPGGAKWGKCAEPAGRD